MAEEFDGILFTKKGKRLLQIIRANGAKMPVEPLPDALSPGIRDSKASELNVKIRLGADGKPVKVYCQGDPWGGPPPPRRPEGPREYVKNPPNPPHPARENIPGDFHNPYNFIPAHPRITADKLASILDKKQKERASQLCDGPPQGHDRYHSGLYSGSLAVTMTVETPLLLPDTAKVRIIGDNHKCFPVRMDAKNTPLIEPTAVKGMLRSAYEAVTNSRFPVFAGHDERLAFRMESTEGAMSVPARIENGKVVLYTGTSTIDDWGTPAGDKTLCAAWLPTYNKKKCKFDPCAPKVIDGDGAPQHGKNVWAWVEKYQHYRWVENKYGKKYIEGFRYWKVTGDVALDESKLGAEPTPKPSLPVPTVFQGKSFHTSLGEKIIKVNGYVCVTGQNQGDKAETGSNIENKHDERIFFNSTEILDISPEIEKEWNILIKNYRSQHDDGTGGLEDPPNAKRKENGKEIDIPLQWSRQIRNTEQAETDRKATLKKEALKDETLCYARIRKLNGSYQVQELFPVSISRRVHRKSPVEFLPPELRPAPAIDELSPADRVFGWVRQGNGNGPAAYRGQVRISHVECQNGADAIKNFGDANPQLWLPMNILGQPKPQQGRFYVAEDSCGTPQQSGCLNNEQAGYDKDGKGLRGRKVYPHQANITDPKYWFEGEDAKFGDNGPDYWKETFGPADKPSYREFLRPKKNENQRDKQQRDKQNRSIQGWVKKGVAFTFDIHFTNLSEVELGALIWLLQLPERHFHKLGGGKPLGFGSVHLALGPGCCIADGNDLKNFYNALGSSLQTTKTPDECKKAFEDACAAAGYANILDAFRQNCRGFDGGLPTHYPRIEEAPNADGKSYEWFVKNNSKWGKRLSLPALKDDPGLPRTPEQQHHH